MRQVVAIVDHKGGVGKTTSAVNIAACWGEIGKRVLVREADVGVVKTRSSYAKAGRLPLGLSLHESLQNFHRRKSK